MIYVRMRRVESEHNGYLRALCEALHCHAGKYHVRYFA